MKDNPKYSIRQEVFFIRMDRTVIDFAYVEEIFLGINRDEWRYRLNQYDTLSQDGAHTFEISEKYLFTSKEELIKSL